MSVDISTEMWNEIATDLAKTRAPSRTAKSLGYRIDIVLQVAEELNKPRSRFEEKFGGKGRPDMEQYTVARKQAWDAWDNTLPEIVDARQKFEEGTHTLATGRDGKWMILYAIPLMKLNPKPSYFIPEVAS